MAPSPARLAVCLAGERSGRDLAALSRASLDRALAHPAELVVSIAAGPAVVTGAFQRPGPAGAILRRASGGPELLVGEGTIHVALALATPSSLMPCDEKRIVNRHVRPLLRALTRAGHLAHYFGRDWISVAHRPAGWVGFAHDAGSRRTLFEAFVAVRAPFAREPRAGFLGKEHGTLESIGGKPVDAARIATAIAEAYAAEAERTELEWPETAGEREEPAQPAWAATVEEAIGELGAGPDARGVFRVGGELLVSRDALASLEATAATAPLDDLPALIDATLAAPGVALDGVKTLTSVLEVIRRAREAR